MCSKAKTLFYSIHDREREKVGSESVKESEWSRYEVYLFETGLGRRKQFGSQSRLSAMSGRVLAAKLRAQRWIISTR
jgi:hypothetical protein